MEAKPEPFLPDTDFDSFMKMDLRVGTVLECERIPKSDKLLRFLLDDGSGSPRTIVSGIAEYYAPETLVGQQVCFIANLPPRKLRGVESSGMILSAVSPDKKLIVISPKEEIAPGSKIS